MAWMWMLGLLACGGEGEEPEPKQKPHDTETATDTGSTDTGSDTDTPTGDTGEAPEIDPGAVLFGGTVPLRVDLEMEEYALESLTAAPTAWVPASIEIEGFPNVSAAVRLKGNGSFQPISDKPSFKVDLDRYHEGNELDGLDDLVLNNMVTDPSGYREHIAYEVYRQMGIPAPRTRHVEVFVNKERRGTYLLLEDADGRFLSRWFEDNDGPLYEMFDVELTPAGVWQLDHDGGPDDRSVLMGLAEVLADPNTRLTVEGAQYLDIESFVAYFGASGVIGQFDAYPYSFPGDDIYLYVNPTTGLIHILPHGGDETFRDTDRPADYVFGLLAVRCLEDPVCEDRFDDAVWATLDRMDAMGIDEELNQLAIDVSAVHMAHFMDADVDGVRADREQLRAFVAGRRADVEGMPGID